MVADYYQTCEDLRIDIGKGVPRGGLGEGSVVKRAICDKIARIGKIVAAFDNEPGNCNAFLEMAPDADVVFVDTQHLPGAPTLAPKVHVVPDFTG